MGITVGLFLCARISRTFTAFTNEKFRLEKVVFKAGAAFAVVAEVVEHFGCFLADFRRFIRNRRERREGNELR